MKKDALINAKSWLGEWVFFYEIAAKKWLGVYRKWPMRSW